MIMNFIFIFQFVLNPIPSARLVHFGHFGDDDGGGGVDDDEQDRVQSVFMLASEWFTLDTLDSCLML